MLDSPVRRARRGRPAAVLLAWIGCAVVACGLTTLALFIPWSRWSAW